ncbi:MAG TPA: AsmA-like C-terminal region-containing protein [Candidatus Paceibacterota bacterium]|nr:AsmA-like C-terminal region-containing protein [Verrucomicrobiota bacterium]HSA10103.1 AsmA-like C-terminal region-containing protein [Candidatus Paceibacterota bacterium]
MATRQKGRFWRTCRVCFRRFRITVWLIVLALLSVLVYLNQVGLPEFAKRPLLEELRGRGVDLQFSRLRLRWYQGIVAENVRFGQTGESLSPQLMLAEVQVRLSYMALMRLQLQVDSLMLHRGRLVWPIADTNQSPRHLTVDNIQSGLRLLPGDEWALDHFTATFAGAHIQLSGTVSNASAVGEWKLFEAKQAAPVTMWRDRLRQVADALEQIHFSTPPDLRLNVQGDARDLTSFAVHVVLSSTSAETPWCSLNRGQLNARLFPANTNGLSAAELNLAAGEAQTRWGAATNLQLTAHLASFEALTNLGNAELSLCAEQVGSQWGSAVNVQLAVQMASMEGQTNLVNADLTLSTSHTQTRWGSATNAQLHATWIHSLTNPIPLSGAGTLKCAQPSSKWGSARDLRIEARLAEPVYDVPPRADDSWAWWANLQPYALDWRWHLAGLEASGVEVDEVACGGQWRAPTLTITNLHTALAGRQLDARAKLDVATRKLHLDLSSDIDPHKLSPVLTEGARRWLAPYYWKSPPELKGEVSLVVPAWTNRAPDWRGEVQPTLWLQGEFTVKHGGAYRNVPVSTAQSHLLYSNMVWRLPDLTLTRPEGRLELEHEADDRTRDYYFRLHSTINVLDLRPLLQPRQQRALDYFASEQPPVIDAEIRGRWREPERTGIRGRVALTNFTFRGEAADGFQAALQYTNRLLLFADARLQRGAQRLSADGVAADFVAQKVYLTNGVSTVEPMVIARAIGPHVARAIEPYRFRDPPLAHVQGTIPMHGEDDADLHFNLKGNQFEWWRFRVPQIEGHVHWLGQHLTLTNVHLALYGGSANGFAHFDFHPRHETDYRFDIATTDTSLQPLVTDLFLTTNHLDGTLNGRLTVSHADTSTLRTWDGHGNLALRDGLIWDVPLFGIFSSVLNGITPGLGSSRASAGTCTFTITNGIIRSNDLEIRSTGMRLQYRGTLDFEGQISARAEADLLRDTWLVGPAFSTMLWPVAKLFEYKVTGTLGEPKGEPVYLLPKVVLLPFQFPFHPLRTLRGLLPEDLGSSRTNALPLYSPKDN